MVSRKSLMLIILLSLAVISLRAPCICKPKDPVNDVMFSADAIKFSPER